MEITIYHNPRCSKSRATLELIRARGIEPEIIEYLQAPPTRAQLESIIELLGVPASAIVRTKESAYESTGLSATSDTDAVLDALVEHPILLERPIVVTASMAVVGRPPENVEVLFE